MSFTDFNDQQGGHWRTKDIVARRRGHLDGANDDIKLRRGATAFAHVLRLLFKSAKFGYRLPVTHGLLYHGARCLHIQFRRYPQEVYHPEVRSIVVVLRASIYLVLLKDGCKFSSEQAVRKRRRVHLYVETVYRVGLHDWQRRNCSQSYFFNNIRF